MKRGETPDAPITGPPDLGLRRRFFSIPTLVAYLVAIGVLAITASQVFDVDWAEMWRGVRETDPVKYLFAFLLYYLSFWFRGFRWTLIAKAAELDEQPGVRIPSPLTAAAIILMGWFANAVAFARLGDAYRGWAFARESGARFSSSLGTVLGERVQDMAVVLVLLLIAAAGLAATSGTTVPGWVIAVAIVLVASLLSLLVGMRVFGLRLANRLPVRMQAAYASFQTGALAGMRPRHLPLQVTLGAIAWLLETARLFLVAQAVPLEVGVEISIWAAMFAALASAMLSTIPTPGGLGFVESGLAGVLILFGLRTEDALALTLVDRSISWFSIIVIGGVLFFAWQIFRTGRHSRGSVPAIRAEPGGGVEGDGQ